MGPRATFILDFALNQQTDSFPSSSASVPTASDKVVTQHFLFKTSEPSFFYLARPASQGGWSGEAARCDPHISPFPWAAWARTTSGSPGFCGAASCALPGSADAAGELRAIASRFICRCPRGYRPKPEISALRPPPKTPPGSAPLRLVVPET